MFKEFYYLMYCRLLKTKTNDTPAFSAYLLVCMAMCFNVLTAIVVLCYFLDISLKNDININTTYFGLTLAISISIINYFALYSRRTSIFEKYKKKYEEKESKRRILFITYEILTYVSFFAACANLIK